MPTTTTAVARVLFGRSGTDRDVSYQQLPAWMAAPIVGAGVVSATVYATEVVTRTAEPAGVAVLLGGTASVVTLAGLVIAALRAATEPGRGGIYGAVRAHLGEAAGTTAGAGLLAGFALTAALSAVVAASAVTSLLPDLAEHRTVVAVVLLCAVTVTHLGGLRHPAVFGATTYGFVGVMVVLLVVGVARCIGGCPTVAGAPSADASSGGGLALLTAFGLGSSLLVGLGTLVGGAPVFRYPRRTNADRTLVLVGGVVASLLVGLVLLAWGIGISAGQPADLVTTTVAAGVLGPAGTWVVQLMTAALLLAAILATYADIPRVTAAMARDRLLPRQLQARGDRLASLGVVLGVAGAAVALVVVAGTETVALVAATVVVVLGVLALACGGVAVQHIRARHTGASVVAAAAATGCALAVVLAVPTTMREGSWPALLLVPALALMTDRIRAHYADVRQQLRRGVAEAGPRRPIHAVILLDRVDEAAARALSYAQATGAASVRALGVPLPEADVERRWAQLAPGVPLEVLQPANSRGVVGALVAALQRLSDEHGPEAFTSAIIPETLSQTWGDQLREHRLALRLKRRLQLAPSLVVTDLTSPKGGPGPYTLEEPRTHHVVVLVAAVDAPTTRALAYVQGLQATSVRALSVNLGAQRSSALLDSWEDWGLDVPLLIVDSPLRSVSAAVRRYVRALLPDGRQTVVTCVLPQVVPERSAQRLLHNQTARLLRSALLFERGVVTTSVPYALRDADGAAEEAAAASV